MHSKPIGPETLAQVTRRRLVAVQPRMGELRRRLAVRGAG